jgi:hypothetical protein
MAGRRFPRPWRNGPIPGGYRVIDANGLALAHVYGEPPNALASSANRLTSDDARRISKLIASFLSLWSSSRTGTRPGEPAQAPAAQVQAGDDRRPDPGGEAAGGPLQLVPAGEAPLYRCRERRPAKADAGAGGGEPSGLLEMRRQEQRDSYQPLV